MTDYATILKDRLQSDSLEARNMRRYLEEMRERLGEDQSLKFVGLFEKALDELDEANEYSIARYLNFPIPKHDIVFTMEILIDVLTYETDDPEIAIRCRNRKTGEVLFLWSYEKFKKRLEMMAEWYADLTDDGIINRDYVFDPWTEFTDDALKKRKEEEKLLAKDKIKLLKE